MKRLIWKLYGRIEMRCGDCGNREFAVWSWILDKMDDFGWDPPSNRILSDLVYMICVEDNAEQPTEQTP